MNKMIRYGPRFLKYAVSIKRAQDFLEHPMICAMNTATVDPNFACDYAFEIKNASYSYENGNKVLWNINLKILKGKNVAILGDSRSGKHS